MRKRQQHGSHSEMRTGGGALNVAQLTEAFVCVTFCIVVGTIDQCADASFASAKRYVRGDYYYSVGEWGSLRATTSATSREVVTASILRGENITRGLSTRALLAPRRNLNAHFTSCVE